MNSPLALGGSTIQGIMQQQQNQQQQPNNGQKKKFKIKAQRNNQANQYKRQQNQYVPRSVQQAPKVRNPAPRQQSGQVGMVQRSRVTKTGMSDIRKLRVSWLAAYIFVSDGTIGAAGSVFLQSASKNWLVCGSSGASSGWAPISSTDGDFGQPYVDDILKHFSRKVIRKMWCHIDSLDPSTSNSMVTVLGFARGPAGAAQGLPGNAGASFPANSIGNVASCKGSITLNSWEHASVDISEFIAGGSGANQNEFNNQGAPGTGKIWTTNVTPTTVDLDGFVPASMCAAGQCSTVGLQGKSVHQIVIEQEIDCLDYLGGMSLTAGS